MAIASSFATLRESRPFYVTGGTLTREAPSYVTREADHALFDGLSRGDFCHVLTSRQMGKSSLMVRTASRLREAGAGVVLLDLTAIGQNLNAEQWYSGLLTQMGQQLDLEDDLEAFWDAHPRLGPLQRWMQAIRRIVLPQCPGAVVIFIDEIDAVRSLPFSTDEFFSAIRECYNRRTEDEEWRRLTFCLLGVAAPSDLIRDTRTTPFNIGRRIELHDFSREEAAPLAAGLPSPPGALLDRALHWTRGHPYLTQRLCQAVAEDEGADAPADVDRICDELFLSHQARERDDNLLFVRERMLRGEAPPADLLTLYGQVQSRRRVREDLTNPLVTTLRLSGIARVERGELRVRNRIYERVFDAEWVKENMPDAELRRQREAYRKGVFRAAAVAAGIIALVGALAFAALTQRNRAAAEARRADRNFQQADQNATDAQKNLREAERQRALADQQRREAINQQALAEEQRGLAEAQRDRAEQQVRANRRLLYSAHMNLAARDWRDASIERMRDLLANHLPGPGQTDLRGFDWYLLWALAHPDSQSRQFSGEFSSVVISPDLKMIATGEDGDVKLWNMASGGQAHALKEAGMQGVVEFSSDGKLLASDSPDHSIRLWDIAAGRELRRFIGHTKPLRMLTVSPDGRMLASGGEDRSARLWDVRTGNLLATFNGHTDSLNSAAFSPDGTMLATGSDDETVKLWNLKTGKELMTLKEHPAKALSTPPWIFRVAFTPDGKRVLAAGNFVSLAIWDVATGRALRALDGHLSWINTFAFSPDGKLLATGSADRTIRLWNVGGNGIAFVTSLAGHSHQVVELMFSRDSRSLASVSLDKTVKLWDVETAPNPLVRADVNLVAYSPDGKQLATARGKVVKLWDTAAWKVSAALDGNWADITSVTYSPDGKTLALGGKDKTIRLWNLATGRERLALNGHPGGLRDVEFSKDGKLLASCGDDPIVRLWNAATGQLVANLQGHSAAVYGVSFSPDGKWLVSAGADKSVRLWDTATHREVGSLKGMTAAAFRAVFSPDGRLLATTDFSDNTIRVWDAATRHELPAFKGHAGAVSALVFSPDGKRLASGGEDFILRLWDVETGQELAAFQRHVAPVRSLAFSPDGKTLVSGGNDGRMNVWRAATEQDVRKRGKELPAHKIQFR
jgi:WD40 repeat protein